LAGIGLSVVRTFTLLTRRAIHVPRRNVGRTFSFANGTRSTVYRETVRDDEPRDPCVLLVEFRLRWVRGATHRVFQLESWLNTPLFVGFPGFVSKLWLAADTNGYYRGLYEWDGAERAEHYVRALWWALIVVSEAASIRYRILPNLTRDVFLAKPSSPEVPRDDRWWCLVPAEATTGMLST
jgi:hypothetical protein